MRLEAVLRFAGLRRAVDFRLAVVLRLVAVLRLRAAGFLRAAVFFLRAVVLRFAVAFRRVVVLRLAVVFRRAVVFRLAAGLRRAVVFLRAVVLRLALALVLALAFFFAALAIGFSLPLEFESVRTKKICASSTYLLTSKLIQGVYFFCNRQKCCIETTIFIAFAISNSILWTKFWKIESHAFEKPLQIFKIDSEFAYSRYDIPIVNSLRAIGCEYMFLHERKPQKTRVKPRASGLSYMKSIFKSDEAQRHSVYRLRNLNNYGRISPTRLL